MTHISGLKKELRVPQMIKQPKDTSFSTDLDKKLTFRHFLRDFMWCHSWITNFTWCLLWIISFMWRHLLITNSTWRHLRIMIMWRNLLMSPHTCLMWGAWHAELRRVVRRSDKQKWPGQLPRSIRYWNEIEYNVL